MYCERRVAGCVRHEQVAAFGSIKLPLTIDGREAFWRTLHETMARLGNRVPAKQVAKIMGQVHARIPMVTTDERREHEIEVAEAKAKFWQEMYDDDAATAENYKQLAAQVQDYVELV